MDFKGKICPYCKTEFKEGEDIVICSLCNMPHHKECWVENQGCTTFGCTGTIQGIGQSEMHERQDLNNPTNVLNEIDNKSSIGNQPVFKDDNIYCPQCGVRTSKKNKFCPNCGILIESMLLTNVNQTSYNQYNNVNTIMYTQYNNADTTPHTQHNNADTTPHTQHNNADTTPHTQHNNVDTTSHTQYNNADTTLHTQYNNADTTPHTQHNNADTTPHTQYNNVNTTPYTQYNNVNTTPYTQYNNVNTTPYTQYNQPIGHQGIYNQNSFNLYQKDSLTKEQRIMCEFIGNNSMYYMKKFLQIKARGSIQSWNWCSFLFPGFWFIYRKMYKYAAIIWLISIVSLGTLNFISYTIMGICGNYLYMKHVENAISKINMSDYEQSCQYAIKKGGVNITGVIITIIALFFGIFTFIWFFSI